MNVGNPTLTLLASEGKEAFIGIPAHQMKKVTSLSAPSIRVGRDDFAVSSVESGRNGRHTVSQCRFALSFS